MPDSAFTAPQIHLGGMLLSKLDFVETTSRIEPGQKFLSISSQLLER